MDLLWQVFAFVVQGDLVALVLGTAFQQELQISTSELATTSEDPPTSDPASPAEISGLSDQWQALKVSADCLGKLSWVNQVLEEGVNKNGALLLCGPSLDLSPDSEDLLI